MILAWGGVFTERGSDTKEVTLSSFGNILINKSKYIQNFLTHNEFKFTLEV